MFVGASFALYIGIAIWARAGSTSEFYAAGRGVHPVTNGMVNEELRELRVTGIIRPQDIDRTNAIPYDKIAEARISYGGRGSVSRQQTRGYGEDVMDVILPY